MKNFFDTENFLWRWFGKLGSFLGLSLLWMLCCLPIITSIPSCIALYDSVAHCVRGNEDHAFLHFLRTLKKELLRGIGLSLLWGVFGFILFYGYSILYQVGKESQIASIYSLVYLGSMLIPMGILAWLIPIESRFTHGFVDLHKTAAAFALAHLPTTAAILGILIVSMVLILFVPVLAIITPAITVTVQSWLIEKVFKKYMPEEDEA
jgi:uncharacterized membrane protein YesL